MFLEYVRIIPYLELLDKLKNHQLQQHHIDAPQPPLRRLDHRRIHGVNIRIIWGKDTWPPINMFTLWTACP
ncbi:MAG: hypothetical protein ACI9RO_001393, partial [Alteromonas macleodii]